MEQKQTSPTAWLGVVAAAFIFFWLMGARGTDFLFLGSVVLVSAAAFYFVNKRKP